MAGKTIGYIRVSADDQNPDRQLDSITLDKRFIDYASARSTDRPQLKMMLDFIREEDIVYVHSMDRLARNLKDLRELVDVMVAKGVEVRFLKEGLTFKVGADPMSNLILSLMGAFWEFELSMIKERQREGIRIARMHNKYLGGHKKITGAKIDELKALMNTRKSKCDIAKELGISRPTLYKYLSELGIKDTPEQQQAS